MSSDHLPVLAVEGALWLADKILEILLAVALAGHFRRGCRRVRHFAIGIPRRVIGFTRHLSTVGHLAFRLKRRVSRPVLSFPPAWEKVLVLAVAVSGGAVGVVMAGLMLFALGPFWTHFGALDTWGRIGLVVVTAMLLAGFKLCSDASGGAWSLTTRTVR